MAIPKKIKNGIAVYSSNCTSGHVLKRIESRISKGYLYIRVHSRTLRKSCNMEATQISISGCVDKQRDTHTYDGVGFSLRKK